MTFELEEAGCALCGRREAVLLFRAQKSFMAQFACQPLRQWPEELAFAIVRCRACGLVYTNPWPSPATLESLYASPENPLHQIPRSWPGSAGPTAAPPFAPGRCCP
ncbi:MAG: hypothetical protein L0332_11145 [Chloroflexi bacterium]|nr:hypothetical protein [Chloroflexota bacterium]MCI0577914.1 hypothetical protein [Chloroflexota bacterium]MCI0645794.1 hypothetical protein [Chloroflexota bacterium]MCI0727263.1 hypothetical protein [Chloroflexota bacterium]